MSMERTYSFLTQALAASAVLAMGALAVVSAQQSDGTGGVGLLAPAPASPHGSPTGNAQPAASTPGTGGQATGTVADAPAVTAYNGEDPGAKDEQLLRHLAAVSVPVDETESETYYHTRLGVISRSQLAALPEAEQAALLGTDPTAAQTESGTPGDTLPAP